MQDLVLEGCSMTLTNASTTSYMGGLYCLHRNRQLHSPTPLCKTTPQRGIYITCYLGNITVEERCGQHS